MRLLSAAALLAASAGALVLPAATASAAPACGAPKAVTAAVTKPEPSPPFAVRGEKFTVTGEIEPLACGPASTDKAVTIYLERAHTKRVVLATVRSHQLKYRATVQIPAHAKLGNYQLVSTAGPINQTTVQVVQKLVSITTTPHPAVTFTDVVCGDADKVAPLITGTVTRSGKPVAGAHVLVGQPGSLAARVTTHADGTFVARFPAGEQFTNRPLAELVDAKARTLTARGPVCVTH